MPFRIPSFLTRNAELSPWDRLQSLDADWFFTAQAQTVRALFHSPQGTFYLPVRLRFTIKQGHGEVPLSGGLRLI